MLSQLYEFKILCENSDKFLRESIESLFLIKNEDIENDVFETKRAESKEKFDIEGNEHLIEGNEVENKYPDLIEEPENMKNNTADSYDENLSRAFPQVSEDKKTAKKKFCKDIREEIGEMKPEDANCINDDTCKYCGDIFPTKEMLNEHFEEFHVCKYCRKEFKSSLYIDTHCKNVHPKEYKERKKLSGKCPICEIDSDNLELHHSETHKILKCPKCRVKLHRYENFLKHVPVCRDTIFLCTYCGRGFTFQRNLTQHTRIHTGERPFLCQFCNKTFRLRSCLIAHK